MYRALATVVSANRTLLYGTARPRASSVPDGRLGPRRGPCPSCVGSDRNRRERGPDGGIGIHAEGVDQGSPDAGGALDGVDDRHVVGVGDSLETVDLADHQVVWSQQLSR